MTAMVAGSWGCVRVMFDCLYHYLFWLICVTFWQTESSMTISTRPQKAVLQRIAQKCLARCYKISLSILCASSPNYTCSKYFIAIPLAAYQVCIYDSVTLSIKRTVIFSPPGVWYIILLRSRLVLTCCTHLLPDLLAHPPMARQAFSSA